jgi:ribosomal protein S18 acetylase RimI-like enzyme
VLPDHQGQKLGLHLTQASSEWLGRDDEIVLNVVIYNAKAIKFYEKLGFKITRELPLKLVEAGSYPERPQYEMVLARS